MAGTAGRPNPTYGWNSYDWSQRLKFSNTLFASVTWSGQTSSTAQTTVTATGPEAAGSRVGILYGTGMGSGGYNCKTPLVANGSTVVLRELRSGTQYHTAAYGIGANGGQWVGPNTLLTTA